MIAILLAAKAQQEVVITPLENNPGLLPFKLGKAKLIDYEHIFIHVIELDKIGESIRTIIKQKDHMDKLENMYKQIEFDNHIHYYKRRYISSNIENIIKRYNSLISKRFKRGLVNELGSLIKRISGNLDYNDAIRYDSAIDNLTNNQDVIKNKINKDISINKQALYEINVTLSGLIENQYHIQNSINILNNMSSKYDAHYRKRLYLDSIYLELNNNIEIITKFLTDLDNILAFTKLGVCHHEIVTISNIQSMVEVLESNYSNDMLVPIQPNELREYYEIIKTGSYFKENTIVIVLKVPILNPESYILYKLYPAPTIHHTVLIPHKPYIVTNGNKYSYTERECKHITDLDICTTEEKITSQIPDCIHHLITHQDILRTCNFIKIKNTMEIIEQLDEAHYLLNLPNRTKLEIRCKTDVFGIYEGSILVNMPPGCSLLTPFSKIINKNNKITVSPVKLISLDLTFSNLNDSALVLDIKDISLSKLHELQHLIERDPLTLKRTEITSSHLALTIPLYVILILLTLGVIFYKKFPHFLRRRTSQNQSDQPEPAQRSSVPATSSGANATYASPFSLQVR
jgi:hypothetical protein